MVNFGHIRVKETTIPPTFGLTQSARRRSSPVGVLEYISHPLDDYGAARLITD